MTFSPFSLLGFTGIGLIILAVFPAILSYRGKQGERYSPLNHFISELGEIGVSHSARLFNGGLFLGGLILLPYVVGLGIKFNNWLGWLGMSAGIITVLGVSAVGIFPMNNLKPHVAAAMTYFRSGLVMVLFFGLAILFQPPGRMVFPPLTNLFSLLAFLAYGLFLIVPRIKKHQQNPIDMLDPNNEAERPQLWALPILEWLVFFSSIAWLLGMAFFI